MKYTYKKIMIMLITLTTLCAVGCSNDESSSESAPSGTTSYTAELVTDESGNAVTDTNGVTVTQLVKVTETGEKTGNGETAETTTAADTESGKTTVTTAQTVAPATTTTPEPSAPPTATTVTTIAHVGETTTTRIQQLDPASYAYGKLVFVSVDPNSPEGITSSGQVCTLTFKVKDNAPDGIYDIEIYAADITSGSALLSAAKSNGSIAVNQSAKAVPNPEGFCVSIQNVRASSGDEVVLSVDIVGNPPFDGGEITLRYDATALEFTSAAAGNLIKDTGLFVFNNKVDASKVIG